MSPSPLVAALDVGGTTIAGGLVDSTGRIQYEHSVPTGGDGLGDPGLNKTEALARDLVSKGGNAVVGLGVGMPEVVDLDGRLLTREVIGWDRQPRDQFAGLAPLLVVESDVRAGALGEAWFGVGTALNDFVYVSVGTGISYAHTVNQQVRTGATGSAVWLGALPVPAEFAGADVPDMELERYASGRAIADRYALLTGTRLETPAVFKAAAAGDPDAKEVVATAGRALGVGIACLVLLVDPLAVIVGGGMGSAPGVYWREAKTQLSRSLDGRRQASLPVYAAGLGVRAGLVGVACAVMTRLSSG